MRRLPVTPLVMVLLALPAWSQAPTFEPRYARSLLQEGAADAGWGACDDVADGGVVECLLGVRYQSDAKAAALAVALYQRSGDLVTVLPAQDFEGGYRGVIHLEPQAPVGAQRHHLEWVAEALREYDAFFAALEERGGHAARYRWRGLLLQFFRSVSKRTPAAFAHGWTVAYNVNGTLNGSPRAVRDLLFHELFHLNDGEHGGWTSRTLAWTHGVIRARCGARTPCLSPYAPDPLIVKGGTYYSFQPGNDEREYGADLALRYWRETREVLAGRPVPQPFKCGPPENAAAWRALVDEFFGGVDLVPACPPVPNGGR